MTLIRSLTTSATALALLLAAGTCFAEEGEFQLGLSTPFLMYSNLTTEEELASVKTESTDKGITWGIGHDVIAELGYGVTPNIVVGGLAIIGGTSGETEPEIGDDIDTSTFNFFLGPKFDWVFLPGDKVQPFVGAVIGLSRNSASVDEAESSLTGFQLMGRFGIRAFPAKEFSIDPQLVLSYVSASGDAEAGPINTDLSVSGFSLGIMFGISGWMD